MSRATSSGSVGRGAGEHVVHFYEDDATLAANVACYLSTGLRAGELAIVIADPAHRLAFAAELERLDVDVASHLAAETLRFFDAADALSQFMRGGAVDGEAFDRVIGSLLRPALASGRPVRAYGEMVAHLSREGNILGALDLEERWNRLGAELRFSLYCSYHAPTINRDPTGEVRERLVQMHSSVLEPAGTLPGGDLARPLPARRSPVGQFAHELITEQLPCDLAAVAAARHSVAAILRARGIAQSAIEEATLVLNELVANAIAHGRSEASVALYRRGARLRIEVGDCRPIDADDERMHPSPMHGLGLVDALVSDWGVEPSAFGKVVWAELEAG